LLAFNLVIFPPKSVGYQRGGFGGRGCQMQTTTANKSSINACFIGQLPSPQWMQLMAEPL
jgi:hypothetical protein